MGDDPVSFSRTPGLEPTDTFLGGGVQVNYDADGRAEFIEFGRVPGLEVVLGGLDLLSADAGMLVRALSANSRLAASAEPGYSFVFPDIGVSLWRSTLPEAADDPDGQRFDSAGVATVGYFGRSD
jgi:hypothetical protein